MSARKPVVVRLYGRLAKQFGKEFRLHIASPAEAVRLLNANFKGKFYKAIRDGEFYVLRGGEKPEQSIALHPMALKAGLGDAELHIIPAPRGASAKKGGIMAILGVVIIGAAIVLSGGTLAAPLASLSAMGGTWYGTMAALGGALLLGGIGQMLTPTPKSNLQSTDGGGTSTQRMFNGPVNVTTQGGCMPLIYGRCYVGSVVGSAGIHLDQVTLPVTPSLEAQIAYIMARALGFDSIQVPAGMP